MTSKGTPIRPVRIGEGLWAAALAKAEEEGTSVSKHIREDLEQWTGYVEPGGSDGTGSSSVAKNH